MSAPATSPQIQALIERLAHHDVRYILNGSIAAIVYGVTLLPSDFDIAPDLSRDNLARMARLLVAIGAKPKFVPTWSKGPSREACESWKPEPLTVEQLDHRFTTDFGELDFVPNNAGSFAELAPRANQIEIFGARVRVAHEDDIARYWRRWGRAKDEARLAKLEALRHGRGPGEVPTGVEGRLAAASGVRAQT